MSTKHHSLINVYSINGELKNPKETLDTKSLIVQLLNAEMLIGKTVTTNTTHILPHTGMY